MMRWAEDLGVGGAGTAAAYRSSGRWKQGRGSPEGLGFVLDTVTTTMAELGSVSLR